MSRDRLFLLPLLAVLFILGACQSEGKLTGEVFIVTEGRENIEMGLIDVRAIKQSKMENHLQKRYEAAKQRIKTYADSVSTLLDTLADARREAEKLDTKRNRQLSRVSNLKAKFPNWNNVSSSKKIRQYQIDNMQDGPEVGEIVVSHSDGSKIRAKAGATRDVIDRTDVGDTGRIVRAKSSQDSYLVDFGETKGWVWSFELAGPEAYKLISENKRSIAETNKLIESIEDKRQSKVDKMYELNTRIQKMYGSMRYCLSGEFYFNELPDTEYSDRTNSRGRFEISVQGDEEYYLVARGDRSIDGGTEKYHWIVDAPVDGGSQREVMLSNNNLEYLVEHGYTRSDEMQAATENLWNSIIHLARRGRSEYKWEEVIYTIAFPDEASQALIPDELDGPKTELLMSQ